MRFRPLLPFVLLFLAACSQSPITTSDAASNALPGATLKTLTQADVPALSTQAGESALVYIDFLLGTDYVTPALTALGYDITVASDWTDFDSKLAVGTFDLAVGLGQGNGYQGNTSVLASYIARGGHAVAVDYEQRSTLATAFDAGYTGTINQTSATFFSPVSAGITNPMTLENPGWGVFSTSLAAEQGGVSYCTFGDASSCLVVGNEGRTALLGFVSDTPPSADGQKLFENIFSLIKSTVQPEPEPYTIDFETAPSNKVLYSVKVGSGIVYNGQGVASSATVPVVGKRANNGKILEAQVARVVSIYGSKRLIIGSSASSNTPSPTGGRIKLSFTNYDPAGAKLTSMTLSNLTKRGAYLTFYYVDGSSSRQNLGTTSAGGSLVIPLAIEGLRAVDVYAPNAYTVDDVKFEVTARR